MRTYKQYIVESFDLNNALPYKKKTPMEVRKLLSDMYKELHPDEHEMIDDELKNTRFRYGYLIEDKDDILLFSIEEPNHTEFHFINLSQKNEYENTNTLGKTSLSVFASIAKIILETIHYTRPIHITARPDRVELYRKIINKVLLQHTDSWEVTEVKDDGYGNKTIVIANTAKSKLESLLNGEDYEKL